MALIFGLLPVGPLADAGGVLEHALQDVSASAWRESLPALHAGVEGFKRGDITLSDGVAAWLRSLTLDATQLHAVQTFVAVAHRHNRALERALVPVLDDVLLMVQS